MGAWVGGWNVVVLGLEGVRAGAGVGVGGCWGGGRGRRMKRCCCMGSDACIYCLSYTEGIVTGQTGGAARPTHPHSSGANAEAAGALPESALTCLSCLLHTGCRQSRGQSQWAH